MVTFKPNGDRWNFELTSDRTEAKELVDRLKPTWLILSPPCTTFCLLKSNINYPKMDPDQVKELKKNSRKHLRFAISLAIKQVQNGKHFLFEHPLTSSSWNEPAMTYLLKLHNVQKVTGHQCMLGLRVHDSDGNETAARKATGFVTSSPSMAMRLNVKCDHTHEHTALRGKKLEMAAFDPAELRLAILRGMRDTADQHATTMLDEDGSMPVHLLTAGCVEPQDAMPRSVAYALKEAKVVDIQVSPFPMKNGQKIQVDLKANTKPRYLDEYTREELPLKELQEAMRDELSYLNENVWEGAPIDEALLVPNAVVVGTRWILSNKQDKEDPDVRARLVAQEVAHTQDESYFAATPPLEAKRALISTMVTERTRNGLPLK